MCVFVCAVFACVWVYVFFGGVCVCVGVLCLCVCVRCVCAFVLCVCMSVGDFVSVSVSVGYCVSLLSSSCRILAYNRQNMLLYVNVFLVLL